MWQAMLKSAGLPATGQVFYHGFINSGGQKMSKSLGNVISPYDMVARYGTDATRYMLLRHVHPTDDSDVTWEKMDEWYTANLVNGLGNLTARIMKMAETHLPQSIEPVEYDPLYKELWNAYEFQMLMDSLWAQVGDLDEYISEYEPYKLVKEKPDIAREHIKLLVEKLHLVGKNLAPIMPDTSKIILAAIAANKKPNNLFPRLES